jgi:type I restriction enzyme, S subunit
MLLTESMKAQKTIKIGDVNKMIFIGNRGKRHYVEKNGIPFLSSSDMILSNPSRFCKMISKNTPGLKGLLVNEGDILISRSGTVGNTIMVNKALAGFAVSEHAMRLVVDDQKIEPEYVYTYLRTEQGQNSLHILPYGSVIVTLGEDYLADVDLPVIKDVAKRKIVDLVKVYNNDLAISIEKENKAIKKVEDEIEKWNKAN